MVIDGKIKIKSQFTIHHGLKMCSNSVRRGKKKKKKNLESFFFTERMSTSTYAPHGQVKCFPLEKSLAQKSLSTFETRKWVGKGKQTHPTDIIYSSMIKTYDLKAPASLYRSDRELKKSKLPVRRRGSCPGELFSKRLSKHLLDWNIVFLTPCVG